MDVEGVMGEKVRLHLDYNRFLTNPHAEVQRAISPSLVASNLGHIRMVNPWLYHNFQELCYRAEDIEKIVRYLHSEYPPSGQVGEDENENSIFDVATINQGRTIFAPDSDRILKESVNRPETERAPRFPISINGQKVQISGWDHDNWDPANSKTKVLTNRQDLGSCLRRKKVKKNRNKAKVNNNCLVRTVMVGGVQMRPCKKCKSTKHTIPWPRSYCDKHECCEPGCCKKARDATMKLCCEHMKTRGVQRNCQAPGCHRLSRDGRFCGSHRSF